MEEKVDARALLRSARRTIIEAHLMRIESHLREILDAAASVFCEIEDIREVLRAAEEADKK